MNDIDIEMAEADEAANVKAAGGCVTCGASLSDPREGPVTILPGERHDWCVPDELRDWLAR